jgi:hypothetical protein
LDLERRRNDVTIEESYESIPDVDELEKVVHEHHLVCFDDMLLEKTQTEIGKYYIRGRKKNRSVINLSQAYAQVGATVLPNIRRNSNYVSLLGLTGDVKSVLQDFNYYDDISMVKDFYYKAISVPMTPFLIDVCGKEYRTGLTRIFEVPSRLGSPTTLFSQATRPKYAHVKGHKATEQDLFESPREAVHIVMETLILWGLLSPTTTVLKPCHGYGAITNVLREKYKLNVIATDLFTLPDKIDFLKEDQPNQPFGILITNPPYSSKYKFIEKCIRLGKPFALLLPLACITTMKWYNTFSANSFVFQILVPRCLFLHDGKWSQIGDIAWIYGNIPTIAKNQVIYGNLKIAKEKMNEEAPVFAKQEKMYKDAPPASSNRKFILIEHEEEEEEELVEEELEAYEDEEDEEDDDYVTNESDPRVILAKMERLGNAQRFLIRLRLILICLR